MAKIDNHTQMLNLCWKTQFICTTLNKNCDLWEMEEANSQGEAEKEMILNRGE